MLPAVLVVVLAVRLAVADQISAVGSALSQVAPLVATGADLTFLAETRHPSFETLSSDVASLARLKTIARWLSGDPLMLASSSHPLAMLVTALANTAYEYVNLALLLDANGVYFAGTDLKEQGGALLRVVQAIGDVDAALSVAMWRAERGDWVVPVLTHTTLPWRLSDLRHPLVDDPVPNSLTMMPGRGALISGSNMSGKSTFLRTVGVNVVLAQSLNTCLASRYEAPFVSVLTCIGRGDDIMAGKSYYMAEVERVLELVASAETPAPHIFLFDELFRGTNTVERIAAAASVLSALVSSRGHGRPHIVLAATHDAELGDLLAERYAPFHFSDRVDADGLIFDFRLRSGSASTRNAIALLAQRGAPGEIVDRALAVAGVLDARRSSGT